MLVAGGPASALQIVRGPYLQAVHPSGITVRWTTDLPADSTVRFGLADTSEQSVHQPSLVTEHEVALTGLAAGTAHLYLAESADGSATAASSQYSFLTAPAAGDAPVRFAAIGDTGSPTASALTSGMLADNPNLIVHVGDIQYGDPADPGSWDTYLFGPQKELLARSPLYPVLGNREYPDGQDPDAIPQLFLDAFTLPGDERFYSFDYGAVHFVALDIFERADDSWQLSAAQQNWLIADLTAAQDAPWRVVYLHYPVFSSSANTVRPWEGPFQTSLVPLFETYRVDWVLTGHHHLYCRSNRNGVSYVITGGGGAALHSGAGDPFSVNPHHHRTVESEFEYLLFEATPTRMTMVARKSDGTEIDRETKSNVRRNVVLLVGSGMGREHVQAGRLWSSGSDAVPLVLEDPARFPFQGSIVTTLPGGGITDSAAAATAMATGWQTGQNGILSEDGGIRTTVLEIARDGGRRTGLVSNGPFVHAAPAAFGAHDNDRGHYLDHRWDLLLDDDASRSDGDHPRSFPEVLLGGGLQNPLYGMDAAYRSQAGAEGYALTFTRTALLDPSLVGRVMGLLDHSRTDGFLQFAKEHLDGLYPGSDEPTLAEMSGKALTLLANGGRGFFLLVENRLIDELSQGVVTDRSDYLGPEVASLAAATQAVLDWVAASGQGAETLILVLSGHETGGLVVPEGQVITPGTTPAMTWSGTAPTSTPVPVYANWPPGLAGQTIDNTEVYHLLTDFLQDGDPPQPVGVTVSDLGWDTATVSWTTAELSSSRADFGPTTGYGSSVEDPARVTSHSLVLTGLSPETLYHLKASSRDLAGYSGSSSDVTFSTMSAPPAPPTGLAATEVPAAGAVDLDWNDNTESLLAGYLVYRAAAPGGPFTRLNSNSTLVPRGAVWKYRDLGQDLGTAWRGSGYDDSAWAQGPAQFGYGEGDEATVVSFGPSSSNKYITTYFRRSFTVNDPSMVASLTVNILRDDGAVVYLNGTEAARANMPTGSIVYTTLAKSSVDGADESAFFAFPISPSLLQPGTNHLAVEVHQRSVSSNDLSFDLELLAEIGPVAQSSYRDPAPPPGVESWYAVSAIDSLERESPLSAAVCARPGPPGAAPADPSAVGLSGLVEIDWSDLADCDLDGYHLERSLAAGGPFLRLTTSPLAESQYTDTAVQAGATYHYRVIGVDQAAQEGPPSTVASATVPDSQPPNLSGIEALEVTPVSARIVWSSDEPADSQVDYGPTELLGGTVSDPSPVTAHSLSLTGLAQGTLYHYQVSSRDTSGNLSQGPVLTFETTTDFDAPVLSDLQVVEITASGARILWSTDEPADSRLEYGLDPTYGQEAFSAEPVAFHSVTLSGLLPATTYHFQASSADLAGNSTSSGDLTFETLADLSPPAPPAGLTAQGGDGEVILDWSDNAEEDLAGYRVYRSIASGGPYDLLAEITASTYPDQGLVNDVPYYYLVTAIDGADNESGPSAEVTGVPHDSAPPSAPTGLAATAADEAVLLSWTGGSEPDLAGFWVYRSTSPGSGFAPLNGSPLAAASFQDGTVLRGAVYYYQVTATDSQGNESAPSAVVSGGTPGFYLSFGGSLTLPAGGGQTFKAQDEDIVRYHPLTGTYTMFFDGTAAGLTSSHDVDAFDLLPDGSILISLDTDTTVPVLGAVDESDVLLWTPGSPARYPGTWAMYFDGSDVELTGSGEDVDAVMLLPDGRLLLSTGSGAAAGGLSWVDEDVVVFTFTSGPGAVTAGTYAWYLDGSDVGLNELSTEDTGGVAARLDGNGFYLVTSGAYSVPGLPAGTGVDVLRFTPTALGTVTQGTYSLILDGSAIGLSDSAKIDGVDLAP